MKILELPPILHVPTTWKVAIVTGLSDPTHCRLSATQLEFLNELRTATQQALGHVEHGTFVENNFPFVAIPDSPDTTQPSLFRASLNNSWQYTICRRESYRKSAARHWQTLIQSTDRLLLITGSCGLQLATQGLWKNAAHSGEIEVLALGPVANRQLAEQLFRLTVVQGKRDWLSRRFCSADVMIPGMRHLEYWSDKRVRKVATEWLLNRISVS
ncbi:MAG: hypothetical protein R3C53_08255 [Pirellulaceae bacterium]